MEAQPDAGLVHTAMETLEEGELRPYAPPSTLFGPTTVRPARGRELHRGAVGATPSRAARPPRRVRRRLSDDRGLRVLWMRLAPHTTFVYIDEPLLVYRLTKGSLSRGPLMGLGFVKTMEKMQRLYPDLSAQLGCLRTSNAWATTAASTVSAAVADASSWRCSAAIRWPARSGSGCCSPSCLRAPPAPSEPSTSLGMAPRTCLKRLADARTLD